MAATWKIIYLVVLQLLTVLSMVSGQLEMWRTHGGSDYVFVTGGDRSWHTARKYCLERGADLISVTSQDENNFFDTFLEEEGYRGTVWIGLNKLNYKDWRWSDASGTGWTKWEGNNPPSGEAPSDPLPRFCAYADVSNEEGGNWKNEHCDNQKSFVCKRPVGMVTPPTMKTDTPTPIVPGYCPAGYDSVADSTKCLKLVKLEIEEGLTWDEARSRCRDGPGISPDIATIANDREITVVLAGLDDHRIGLWIGLRLDPFPESTPNQFKWVDNSPLDYTNWGPSEPASTPDPCIEIWIIPGPPGTWNDAPCTHKRGYICQTYKDEGSPIASPPVTPSHTCPEGFTPYGQSCYNLLTTGDTWVDATQRCLAPSALASIHSASENAAIQLFLASQTQLSTLVWIGLKYVESSSIYYWSDNWHVTYTKWAVGQPSRGEGGGCVGINMTTGAWSDEPCNTNLPVLCKYTEVAARTTPPPTEGICPKNTTTHRWVPYGDYCYAVPSYSFSPGSPTSDSWPSAQQNCYNVGANLASVHDPLENLFIAGIINSAVNGHWIGMSKSSAGEPYLWYDGSEIEYTNWNPGEPNDKTGIENCVKVLRTSAHYAWDDTGCTNYFPYACKIQKRPAPTTPVPPVPGEGSCPGPEWVHYGSDCFLFRPDSWHTWDEAQRDCKAQGAFLTVVKSHDENWFVHNRLVDETLINFPRPSWIGYSQKTSQNDKFTWSDGLDYNYTHWAEGHPPISGSADGFKMCVFMNTNEEDPNLDERWTTANCTLRLGYSCRTEKYVPKPDENSASSSVSGGVIAGALIGTLLGMALCGVVGYFGYQQYLRHKRNAAGMENISYVAPRGSAEDNYYDNVQTFQQNTSSGSAGGGRNSDGVVNFGYDVDQLDGHSQPAPIKGRLALNEY